MFKVQIPHGESIKFPDECGLCGKENPNSRYQLDSGSAFSDLFSNRHMQANSVTCMVPVCKECEKSWTWRRWNHWIVMVGAVICLGILARAVWPMIPADWMPLSEKGSQWIFFIVVLLIALPLSGFVKLWFPLPITLHSYPELVEFVFQDEDLGNRFDVLNNFEEVDEDDEEEED